MNNNIRWGLDNSPLFSQMAKDLGSALDRLLLKPDFETENNGVTS